MKLIEIIRENRLIYLTLDKLSQRLAQLTKEAEIDLKIQINELIKDGTLFLDDDKRISISADRGYYKAKMVLNKKGYGFAQVEGYFRRY